MNDEQRYKVVACSESAHCCFEATIVDTHTPLREGSNKPDWVCECFDIQQADKIAAALNQAQDLLECLEGLLAEAHGSSKALHPNSMWSMLARAAIARAKGEPQ